MIKIFGKGAVPRSRIVEESASEYPIPLFLCRNENGTVIDTTGGAGKFHLIGYGYCIRLVTEQIEAGGMHHYLRTEFTLPPEYVSGTDITLAIHAHIEYEEASPGDCTVDVQAFPVDDRGESWGDTCQTAAQSLSMSWATKEFTLSGNTAGWGDLKPGDKIKDMTCYAPRAMITVDTVVKHTTKIEEGNFKGQYIIGIESSEIIESCRPPWELDQ